MGELTGDQVRQNHLEKMGSELGPLYHALWVEVCAIHGNWNQYKKLFGHSRERVDTLNRAAGFFFGLIEKVLRENVLLHIARLTDPPQQGVHKNLCLLRMADMIRKDTVKAEVRSKVEKAIRKAELAREWRNKRLAHRDHALAANEGNPLKGVSRKYIEDVLAAFRGVLNTVSKHYLGSEELFEKIIPPLNDADALVRHLRVALRERDSRLRRLREGRPLPQDLEPTLDNQ